MSDHKRPGPHAGERATRRAFLRRASLSASAVAMGHLLPFEASAQMPLLPEIAGMYDQLRAEAEHVVKETISEEI